MIYSHFKRLSIQEKNLCVNVFGLVQKISRLDSLSSRCLHYFPATTFEA